jgi:hypothetical protein
LHDRHAGLGEGGVQGVGVVGLEPQRDPPAQPVDRVQVDGGLADRQRIGEVANTTALGGLWGARRSPSCWV